MSPGSPAHDRPPVTDIRSWNFLGSAFVARWASRWLLPLLFIPFGLSMIGNALEGGFAFDGYIYYRASAAFVAGGDPWGAYAVSQASGLAYHFYALPTMVVLGVPLTLLPESIAVGLQVVVALLASIFVVRRLGLPWYWLAFPPLVQGVVSANPSLIVLALLLTRFAPLAPLFKVYAIFPMLGEARWRALAVSGVLIGATMLLWPSLWLSYAGAVFGQSARQMVEAQGGMSGAREPLLFAGALVAIVLIARVDRRAAGWLLVPALWPASQFHWSTLAMPVMTAVLAILLSLPVSGLPAVAVMVYAIMLRRDLITAVTAMVRGRSRPPAVPLGDELGELDDAGQVDGVASRPGDGLVVRQGVRRST